MMRVCCTAVGIDLAGSPGRATGICIIGRGNARLLIAGSDSEILSFIKPIRGRALIGIDAPLSLPPGRKSIDMRGPFHLRKCDESLRERGIRFFPITLGPMRMLTRRGMSLKRKILSICPRAEVFEVYPGATYDVFGIPRRNGRKILRWAREYAAIPPGGYSQDELDAAAAAITMVLHARGESEALGSRRGGLMIIPRVAGRPARQAPGRG